MTPQTQSLPMFICCFDYRQGLGVKFDKMIETQLQLGRSSQHRLSLSKQQLIFDLLTVGPARRRGPVDSPVKNLLVPLAMSITTSIRAAGSGMYGEVPKLRDVDLVIMDGITVTDYTYPMAKKLLMLDLSQNNVSELSALPVLPNLGRVLLRDNHQLTVAPEALTDAPKHQIILDLSGTELKNHEEVAALLLEGGLKTTDVFSYRSEAGGYACKELRSSVTVSPPLFLPRQLCKCFAGWQGDGATCEACPANTWNDNMGESCKSCPPNSTSPVGSTKEAFCKCDFGDLHKGLCACDKHQTLKDGNCILCSKLHLQCNSTGSNASFAMPEVGHMRLEPLAEEAHKCLPPAAKERCPGKHECGTGYSGTLCASCADGFWAKRGLCQ